MKIEHIDFGIESLRRTYSSGALTPVDVISESYRRIRDYSNQHVWTKLVDEAQALSAARALAARRDIDELPLYGIPFSVKDNINVAEIETTCGCDGFKSLPEVSAFGVNKAIEAGAIFIGKNNLDQFATGLNGTRSLRGYCRNSFDQRYVPGGSSSGSGVAVAAGLVSFALGSDTGGSGRVPAAMNNVVGVKPTIGLVSSRGMVYNNRFFDCIPVFARTVQDGYTVLDCIRGYDAQDPYSRADADAIPLTASIGETFHFAIPHTEQLEFFGDEHARNAFEQAIGNLVEIGGVRHDIDFSLLQEAGRLPFDSGLLAERVISYGRILHEHPETVHPAVAGMLSKGSRYSGAEVLDAVFRTFSLRRAAAIQLAPYDIVVTPTVGRAYTCAELESNPIDLNNNIGHYTYGVSPLDLCALAVPSCIRPDGIPFGISMLARSGCDGVLRELGMRYQRHVSLRPGVEAKMPRMV
jgi:allophanate hydrolase